tara:strand:- start:15292 stop:15909 length:618 start_codon:yes stop_codon:yes gene_type:complete
MLLDNKTLNKGYKYLSKDECLNFLIKKFSREINIYERYNPNFAEALSYLIIEQQISFKAAITIKKRFSSLIESLSSQTIIDLDNKVLQNIGISFKKVEYIKNVYGYFQKSDFDFKNSNDSEIIKELTKIKGIGLWSSEMFLMFVMMRINIFSKGDLALINSVKINYAIDPKNIKMLDQLIDSWSPYKSVASLLLWKSIEEKIFFR